MIAFVLRLMGLRIVYTCEWGEYSQRYSYIDWRMNRPIHRDMSVAPPWAYRQIVRIQKG